MPRRDRLQGARGPGPNRCDELPLLGVDFSSAPSRRKPITLARGVRHGDTVVLHSVAAITDFSGFEALLARAGPWLGAFDFPFGLPRAFVDSLALGATLAEVMAALGRRCVTRMGFRALVDGWGNTRPAGQRLLHRACDAAEPGVTSSSPLQTRYVPVGFMFFEGVRRLLDAGVTLPGQHAGDPARVALEAYPGLLAHELLGARSYKNGGDDGRRAARAQIIAALRRGGTRLALKLSCPRALEAALLDDAGGDLLDAALCLVQAGWASAQPGYGMPAHADPVEGWITSAGAAR